jgi:hypothetical protein
MLHTFVASTVHAWTDRPNDHMWCELMGIENENQMNLYTILFFFKKKRGQEHRITNNKTTPHSRTWYKSFKDCTLTFFRYTKRCGTTARNGTQHGREDRSSPRVLASGRARLHCLRRRRRVVWVLRLASRRLLLAVGLGFGRRRRRPPEHGVRADPEHGRDEAQQSRPPEDGALEVVALDEPPVRDGVARRGRVPRHALRVGRRRHHGHHPACTCRVAVSDH